MKLKLTEHICDNYTSPPLWKRNIVPQQQQINKQIRRGTGGLAGWREDVEVMATGAGRGMALLSGGALEQADDNEAPTEAAVMMKDACCTRLKAEQG